MPYQVFFFTGGPGNEANISRESCRTYFNALEGYSFLELNVFDGNPDGTWKYIDSHGRTRNKVLTFSSVLDIICQSKFPLVVPVLHGTLGEDGKMAAVFESLKIPCLFSGSQVCALTLNKIATCRYLSGFGINVPQSTVFFGSEAESAFNKIKEWLVRYSTLVLKPLSEGSSIHMTITSSEKEIKEFLDTYWKYHQVLMVEEYIQGKEYTAGVFEDPSTGELKVLPPLRIHPLESHFFDYEAKYVPGKAEESFILNLSPVKEEELCSVSLKISCLLRVSGLARSDYIYNQVKDCFYFLEINTIPGLTTNSLIPQAIRQAGYALEPFLARLLATAMKNPRERKKFLSCFK